MAKTFDEWVETESATCRGIQTVSVGRIIWNAATKAAEEKFTSTNKQTRTCNHKWKKVNPQQGFWTAEWCRLCGMLRERTLVKSRVTKHTDGSTSHSPNKTRWKDHKRLYGDTI